MMSIIFNDNGTATMRVPVDQVRQDSELRGGDVIVRLSRYDTMSLLDVTLGLAAGMALTELRRRQEES
jgi:hypothetical protein